MALIPALQVPAAPPGTLQRFVDWLQAWLFPNATDDVATRWVASLVIFLGAVLLGKFMTGVLFIQLRRLLAKSNNKLMLPAIEPPAAALVILSGVIFALSVSPIWSTIPTGVRLAEQGALAVVILWGVACAGSAMIDHLAEGAKQRRPYIAAFLPLIKKTLGTIFVAFSALVVCESMGFEVKTFLAGLGIGGLAVALAAQDSLSNMFGSFVVVMDQPFYVGEVVSIAGHDGTVEGIGLRSTRLRTAQRTQVVIPNKTVAAEVIINYSRMPQRRVDTTLGVTYDTPPEKIQQVLGDLRAMLRADPGVHPGLVVASLADFSDSSLRIQVVYFTADPDWEAHMAIRERVNLGILRTFAARGVSLAYPSSVIHLDGPVARQMASNLQGPSPASGGSA